eukprot:CAMPEP_0180457676 /NCGR_PEP_ID=MMETSP1036_2-20121128/21948_1 /TAXON_ID=632150 /ORGANISM="Azadinium spinosum, Strain 3D9" /LENGTH=48 /DNA_ID= /DNA_START= /DNA_END= /DNA_ORIENTATION=
MVDWPMSGHRAMLPCSRNGDESDMLTDGIACNDGAGVLHVVLVESSTV